MQAYYILLSNWHARGKRMREQEAGTETGNPEAGAKCVGMVIPAPLCGRMRQEDDFPAGDSHQSGGLRVAFVCLTKDLSSPSPSRLSSAFPSGQY